MHKLFGRLESTRQLPYDSLGPNAKETAQRKAANNGAQIKSAIFGFFFKEIVMVSSTRIFQIFESLVRPVLAPVALAFVVAGCGSQAPLGSQTHSDTAAAETTLSMQETRAIESFEDCIALDLATIAVKFVGGEWKIVDGPNGNHWAFSFGSHKDEAYKALGIIQAYKFANSCFVSRPGPKMMYQLNSAGNSAVSANNLLAGEDCISFNNAAVEAKWFPAPINSWKIVQGNMWMLDFGLDQAGVHKALRVIKLKKFNQQCFVGRPDPSFSYWKIKSTP